MKNDKRLLLLAAIVCGCVTGCTMVKTMQAISQVSMTSDAGTILPELQWHEQITITRSTITLTRNGRVAETEVNTGCWEFAADEEMVAALFEQLEAVDLATIERVEPDDPPDGGGTKGYMITYGRGEDFSLGYDPGVTYTNGEVLVGPIEAFLQGLSFPAEAAARYASPMP